MSVAIRTLVHAADELWSAVEEIGIRFDGEDQGADAERIREIVDRFAGQRKRVTIDGLLAIAELIRSVHRLATREI